ncbi:MAG: hypothetical protein Kow0099_05910 [Candidatus Abyssubacteria bacterium]
MALLITLLVTIILAVVVLEFNYLMRVHATLSGNLLNDLRTEAAARAGVEMAKARLLSDLQADLEAEFESDTLEEEWASEIEFEMGAITVKTVVADETAKLNVNRLITRPMSDTDIESVNQTMADNLKRLLLLLELDQNLVDGIIDWLDEDEQEQPFGAESSYYLSLNPPVLCKNGPIDSVDELLLVKGITRKILYGDSETPGLAQFITVAGDKEGRININTADEKTLSAVLNSESVASMLIESRNETAFKSEEDMTTRYPDLNLAEKFTTQGLFFLVTSTGELTPESASGRAVTLKALLKRIRSGESDQAGDQYMSVDTAYWKIER